MTCTAASHQRAVKEPTASLFRTCEAHDIKRLTCNLAGYIHILGFSACLYALLIRRVLNLIIQCFTLSVLE